MKSLEKRTKLLLVSTVVAIALISLAIAFLPSILNLSGNSSNSTTQYYDLNQEIAGFPAVNTSMAFTSWTYTSSFIFEAGPNKNLVIVNFTLRNIADSEIETSTNLQYLPAADSFTPRDAPLLKYGGSYAKAETDFPYSHYWGLWATQNTLLLHESVAGYLVYKIPQENTPIELVFPNAESPKIIVRLQ